METPNKPYGSRVAKSSLKLLCWAIAWLASIAVLAVGDGFLWQEANTVHAVIVFAIAVLVGIGMVIAYKNYVNKLDELNRKVMLEAMAITLGVPLAVGIPYSLLVDYDVAVIDRWFGYLIMLMSLTFIVSVIAGLMRYK